MLCAEAKQAFFDVQSLLGLLVSCESHSYDSSLPATPPLPSG